MHKIKEIRQNIHECIYELVRHMNKLGIAFDTPQNSKSGEWILDLGNNFPQYFDDVSVKLRYSYKMEYEI